VTIGPSAKARLSGVPEPLIVVGLLDDELIELRDALSAEIERHETNFGETPDLLPPSAVIGYHPNGDTWVHASSDDADSGEFDPEPEVTPPPPEGDRVFWIEQPDRVHRAGCASIDLDRRGSLASVRGVLAVTQRQRAVSTCRDCAPFGVTEVGDTWIYRDSTGSFWTAHRRLSLVSEAIQRRASARDEDESSQST
jgi:hypothetical protein